MNEPDDPYFRCTCCGEEVLPGQTWVALNRYLIGGGGGDAGEPWRGIREAQTADEYEWFMDSEDPEEWEWSGLVMHAACVPVFVEGELIESRARAFRKP